MRIASHQFPTLGRIMGTLPPRQSAWLRLLLLVALCMPSLVGASNVTIEYQSGPLSFVACSDGGTTSVVDTTIGHVTYVRLYVRNGNARNITTSSPTFSGLVGCTVVWNTLGGTAFANDASFGDIAIRPTAATWSFALAFAIDEAPGLSTFTHTLTASGIPSASGAQMEVAVPYATSGGTDAYAGGNNQFPIAYVGQPIPAGCRITSRSSLQDLAVAAPGWSTSGSPVNCSVDFAGQPPALLGLDQSIDSTFRVTVTAPGPFSATIGLVTNDDQTPFTITISGTGYAVPRLSVLNGTQKIASYSQVSVDTPVGQDRVLTFTLRNDDTVPITLDPTLPAPNIVACDPVTILSPLSPLPPGATTTWQISFGHVAVDWQFLAFIRLDAPSSHYIQWMVANRTSADPYQDPPVHVDPAGDDHDGGKSSRCGLGSGLASWALLALGWSALRLGARRRRSAA